MTSTRRVVSLCRVIYRDTTRNAGVKEGAQWMQQSQFVQHARAFSSSASSGRENGPWSDPIQGPVNRYLIIAEDYTGPGALARRLEVRDRHLEQAARGKESGRIELGGGLLNKDFKDIDEEKGVTSALAGSVFVVQGRSLAEVRERLERDEYSQAGVFDPSRTRIFPFLRSLNEQSIAVGNEAVGDLHPVSSRRPKGESTVKSSLRSRKEIYVKDPRGSGLSLNSGDRKSAQNTLGHLRSTQKKIVPQPTTVTLDNLRKNPSMPPNLEG